MKYIEIREMIFEQLFYDNFFRILILCFYSLYCFRFCTNTYISLYNLVVSQVISKNGCSNKNPLKIIS